MLPRTLPWNPGWLEPLWRAFHRSDTAAHFPLLDWGEGALDVAVNQALLHDVLWGLRGGGVVMLDLFMDERWNAARS